MVDTGLIGCVIYAAKSTEDRRGSIPDQLRECRAAIESTAGCRVAGEYTDVACSAYSEDRGPGLLEAMGHVEELVEADGAAQLWAQHSDRLARGDGRSARHAVEIALWALKRGIKVRTVQDPDTFRDLLYAVVVGQRNHEDSHRRSLAVAAGHRRAAERGEHRGYRPDGHRFEASVSPGGAVTKRLVIDQEREPVIRMILGLALAGKQPGEITAAINKAGHLTPWVRGKPPCPWTVDQVCHLLRNPRYAGLSPYKGEIVACGQWPAYITESEHYRIIARIGKNKPTKHHRRLEPYLLARVASCGRCGSRLYIMTGHERNDGTFLRRYTCASHTRVYDPNRCPVPPLCADEIEQMFVAHIHDLLLADADHEPAAEAPQVSGWTRSPERQELLAALNTGDDRQINELLERLFAHMAPETVAMRELAISRRHARQLDAAQRLESWAHAERAGRTDTTRSETVQLNRLIRSWFSEIAVTANGDTVIFTAQRRPTGGTTSPPRAKAHVDRQAWARMAQQNSRPHRRYRRWGQAEILGALQAWASLNGRSPSFCDWRKGSPYHPSSLPVRKRFGSWPKALRIAGLAPTYPQAVPRNTPWTDAEVLIALRAWVQEHGRPPTWADWLKAAPDRPCTETVRTHFGSFNAGVAAAQMQPAARGCS